MEAHLLALRSVAGHRAPPLGICAERHHLAAQRTPATCEALAAVRGRCDATLVKLNASRETTFSETFPGETEEGEFAYHGGMFARGASTAVQLTRLVPSWPLSYAGGRSAKRR